MSRGRGAWWGSVSGGWRLRTSVTRHDSVRDRDLLRAGVSAEPLERTADPLEFLAFRVRDDRRVIVLGDVHPVQPVVAGDRVGVEELVRKLVVVVPEELIRESLDDQKMPVIQVFRFRSGGTPRGIEILEVV